LLKGYIIASKRYYFGGVSSEKLAILPSMEVGWGMSFLLN
jgi:hypothetical protein